MGRRTVAAGIVCAAGMLFGASPASAAETVYGLTAAKKLVTFASDQPGLTSTPYVFTASGQVKLPAGTTAAACAGGKVTIRLKRGTGALVSRTAARDANCKFSQKLTYKVSGRGVLRSPRTLRITARFAGTAQLLPRSAATKTVKAG